MAATGGAVGGALLGAVLAARAAFLHSLVPYDRTLWRRLHSPASVCLMALAACPSWGVRALFFGAYLGSNLPNPKPKPNPNPNPNPNPDPNPNQVINKKTAVLELFDAR